MSRLTALALLLLAGTVLVEGWILRIQDREIKDQIILNQKLIDYANKHEYYSAVHHCALQKTMQTVGLLPPMTFPPCVPQFLKHEGYYDPEQNPRTLQRKMQAPIDDKERAWSSQTSTQPNFGG